MAKAPISRHPLFPALVAAWFAGLLGLGCLTLPAVLLERAVDMTGLAAILPAAAPPLGQTARLLIALAAAGLGAGLGLLVARQVVRAHAAATGYEPDDSRRPIGPHDRRGLLGDFIAQPLELATAAHRRDLVDQPLDLLHFAEAIAEVEVQPQDDPVAQGTSQTSADPEPLLLDTPLPMATGPDRPGAEPEAADWATAPLETLTLLQLTQRLGSSLEKRRAQLAAAAAAPARPLVPAELEAAPAEEIAQGTAAYFGHRPSEPTPGYDGPADADEALRRALATLQRMSAAG